MVEGKAENFAETPSSCHQVQIMLLAASPPVAERTRGDGSKALVLVPGPWQGSVLTDFSAHEELPARHF